MKSLRLEMVGSWVGCSQVSSGQEAGH